MMRSISRQGGIRAGLLLALGLVCAFVTPANAEPASGACMGRPHYPKGMTDPKDSSVAFTRDSAEQVVAWFKKHLVGGGPGGDWVLVHKHNRESSTWIFAMDINHIRVDWRADKHTVRIRYLCP
jgi:hypothetical protein